MSPSLRQPVLIVLVAAACGLASCRCSPDTPTAITMRVTNATRAPIYIDDTKGALGLQVQRDVGGQRFGFDDLACTCSYCTNACDPTCSCPDAGPAMLRRVGPGESAERRWTGVVQLTGVSNCRGGAQCLNQENAPLDETFTLQLCFATQKPFVTFDDAGVAPGVYSSTGQTCLTKDFKLQDGVVAIGPQPGAACSLATPCTGSDELCIDGSCTAGCPGNDFPTGSAATLYVPSPDDMGFFTQVARDGGTGTVRTGTGTISAVVYSGTSLEVSLTRPGAGGTPQTGKLTVQFPKAVGPPLMVGTAVSVAVVDDGQSRPNRAAVVRQATTGQLLFAADMALGGDLLTAGDLDPIVTTADTVPLGCVIDDCGRFVEVGRLVAIAADVGTAFVSLTPGALTTVTAGSESYSALSVVNGKYLHTTCTTATQRAWTLWKN